MTEPRRWPELDADEEAFVDEFRHSLGALRERMTGCPPVDLLLAAEAGVLPEGVQREVSTHLSRCSLCQGALRDIREAAIEGASTEEAARVRRRFQPMAFWQPKSLSTPPWPRGFIYATAASVVAIIALGAWAVQLQRQNQSLATEITETQRGSTTLPSLGAELPSSDVTAQTIAGLRRQFEAEQARAKAAESALATLQRQGIANEPQVNVPMIDLEPIDALRSMPGQSRTIELAASATLVTLLLSASGGNNDAEYVLEIRDPSGRVAWQGSGLRKSPLNTFSLVVPKTLLPTGDIDLRLFVMREGKRRLTDQYSVHVVAR